MTCRVTCQLPSPPFGRERICSVCGRGGLTVFYVSVKEDRCLCQTCFSAYELHKNPDSKGLSPHGS